MKFWTHRKGDSGQEVKRIQKTLSIKQDGVYGDITKQAVQEFQNIHNLDIDGIVGPQTRKEMEIEIYAGIDVSKWNKIQDWGKLKLSGLADFCWIKLTEGNNYVCPVYKKHAAAAAQVQIPYGAYHFARPDLHIDPFNEVRNFVNNCQIEKGLLRPVLDFEKAGDHEPDSLRNWVLTFLKEFESQTGVEPLVYTGGNMTKYHLSRDTTGIDDYTLWHAYYPRGKNLTKGIKKDRLGGWKEWRIWQWTGSGEIEGTNTKIDRNWLVGGKKGLSEIFVN